MSMLDVYLFTDEDGQEIAEAHLMNDEAADNYCQMLAREHKVPISAFKVICVYVPEDVQRDAAEHRDEAAASEQICPNCEGSGRDPNDPDPSSCPVCKGAGQI